MYSSQKVFYFYCLKLYEGELLIKSKSTTPFKHFMNKHFVRKLFSIYFENIENGIGFILVKSDQF